MFLSLSIYIYIYNYTYIIHTISPSAHRLQRGFYILQRGVQRKQGVVFCTVSCTSLLYNTTPIHCTPFHCTPLCRVSRGAQSCLVRQALYAKRFIVRQHIVFVLYCTPTSYCTCMCRVSIILYLSFVCVHIYIYIYNYICM